ncbi:type IV secretion system DNA-binding domain-containing protein [Paraburkholderia tropica]|uniref:type IV secretion system DNA-binding domain-containing protein n=1 Tax=Paraburkholderia tropica TaxID=92647 RepID=UPI0031E1CBB5
MSKKANDCMVYWFAPPPNIAPSQKYAVRATAIKDALPSLLLYVIFLPVVWLLCPGDPGMNAFEAIWDGFAALLSVVTHGRFFTAEAYDFSCLWTYHSTAVLARLTLAALPTLALATYLYRDMMTPRNNVVYLDGPRLLEGDEAVSAAIREARGPSVSETLTRDGFIAAFRQLIHPPKNDPYMSLCPSTGMFSRTWWTKHLIIVGKIGSGKTMLLLHILDQIVLAKTLAGAKNRAKSIILDAKGDFTSFFKRAMILNPWDKRTGVWDIAADLADMSSVKKFAACMLPVSGGSGKFFDEAAQKIMVAAIRTLHHTHGNDYGFTELAARHRLGQQGLADLFAPFVSADPYIEMAYNDVKNPGNTVDSILSTLSNGAAMLTDLAMAWPTTVPNDKRPRFSCRGWARDDWKGPRHIILRGKSGNPLTEAFIAALFNMLTPRIMDLPDSKGRNLFMVCDEFTAPGKLEIMPLIDKGRSKGCCVILGFQDSSQITEKYGAETQKTILSTIGSKIICQVAAGETADKLSDALGKQRVLITNKSSSETPGQDKASVTSSRHEETRTTVPPHELTNADVMGPRTVPKSTEAPAGFVVRAILSMGKDALRLTWPGHDTDARIMRPVDDEAEWALPITGPLSPEPTPPEPDEPAPPADVATTQADATAGTVATETPCDPASTETASTSEGGPDAGDPDELMDLLDDVSDPMDDITDPMDDEGGGLVQAIEPVEPPAEPVAEPTATVEADGPPDDGSADRQQVVSVITYNVPDPVAAAKLAAKEPKETVGADLGEVAAEVAQDYAADAIGEAIGIAGGGGLLDFAKIVDLYHESKTPTGPTTKQTVTTIRGR